MGKRLSILLVLVVGLLTAFAFTAGSGLAQTTGTSTSTTGGTATVAATVAPTATKAATVAATSASSSAVATGTGGGTVTTLPATGQAQGHSINFLLIELLVLGLAVIATGIALRRRSSRT